jgi:hypothetical protein
VTANKKRWRAEIYCGGKKVTLGTFGTKQEAAYAYDKAARACWPEKKALNYDSIEAAAEAAAGAAVEKRGAQLSAPLLHPSSGPISGYCGVSANGKRWAAKVHYGGKHHYIGSFSTKQEAALAYDREARRCGETKPLNYDTMEQAEEAAAQAKAEYTLMYGPCLRARPKSGYYGVCADKHRWRATLSHNGKQRILGRFNTKQEAALAYDKEARLCGEDKALNSDISQNFIAAVADAARVKAGGLMADAARAEAQGLMAEAARIKAQGMLADEARLKVLGLQQQLGSKPLSESEMLRCMPMPIPPALTDGGTCHLSSAALELAPVPSPPMAGSSNNGKWAELQKQVVDFTSALQQTESVQEQQLELLRRGVDSELASLRALFAANAKAEAMQASMQARAKAFPEANVRLESGRRHAAVQAGLQANVKVEQVQENVQPWVPVEQVQENAQPWMQADTKAEHIQANVHPWVQSEAIQVNSSTFVHGAIQANDQADASLAGTAKLTQRMCDGRLATCNQIDYRTMLIPQQAQSQLDYQSALLKQQLEDAMRSAQQGWAAPVSPQQQGWAAPLPADLSTQARVDAAALLLSISSHA